MILFEMKIVLRAFSLIFQSVFNNWFFIHTVYYIFTAFFIFIITPIGNSLISMKFAMTTSLQLMLVYTIEEQLYILS